MSAPTVLARFPHDPDAFTQGLEFYQGRLYESTGLEGYSTLRVVDTRTGRVLRSRAVAPEHFAEGLTVFRGRVYQLTYRSGRCFVYDADTLEPVREFTYPGEGWGLSHDDQHLLMSDGTDTLRVLDPETFTALRTVRVTDGGVGVIHLNELELLGGELWANVWGSDRIARIDPRSGRVLGWLDLSAVHLQAGTEEPEAVLNGIAYEPTEGRLFITGKLWPWLFELRPVPPLAP
ncbi:MAG: glutaminyl-peptide cyclotransferase [Deltaproteobacteria bacterium]|nr:glutaminyl-peptide cyclotransferase [Deltaproteobacteria bacterium]